MKTTSKITKVHDILCTSFNVFNLPSNTIPLIQTRLRHVNTKYQDLENIINIKVFLSFFKFNLYSLEISSFLHNLLTALDKFLPVTTSFSPIFLKLTLRSLTLYIYMEHLFLMFLDHTQRRNTVGRTPLDE